MKKKAGTLIYGLAPLALMYTIQILVSFGFYFGMGIMQQLLPMIGADAGALGDFINRQGIYAVSVLSYGIFLIPAFFWYQRVCRYKKFGKEADGAAVFGFISCVKLFFIGLCMQFGASIVLQVVYVLNPELMKAYAKVMESLGMESPQVLSVIYVVLLAPVAEEVLMRGLCLNILRRDFPFWAANTIQAFLFGLIHMNLVQGTYAFVFGIVLGCIYRKYNSLKGCILCHFFVNLSGQLMGLFEFGGILGLLLISLVSVVGFLALEKIEKKK